MRTVPRHNSGSGHDNTIDRHLSDFTKGDFVFEKDALTPNELMPKLKQAFQMITAYWAGKTHP
jgi:hypothetical protein